jgi:hypothetical protein
MIAALVDIKVKGFAHAIPTDDRLMGLSVPG